MRGLVLRFSCFAVALFLCFSTVAHATTYYVALSGSHESPYTNWYTAATNIQAAIDVSQDGDVVLVTNGVYCTGVVSNEFGWSRVAITNGITLQSVNGPTNTSIQGDNSSSPARCVYINHTNAALLGFTLTNGYATNEPLGQYRGGGALICNLRLMSNCIVRSCHAVAGGGVAALFDGPITITDCTMKQNESSRGGGIGIFWGGHTVVQNCLIESNYSMYGGGMVVDNCTGVRNCLVVNNHSYDYGGGVVVGNNAGLSSCTVEGNTADNHGDGIYISGNGAVVRNSIFFYNGGENLDAAAISSPNRQVEYCCSTPLTSSLFYARSCSTNAPDYVDQTGGNYTLSSNSLCIDRGINETWMKGVAKDLYGEPRIMNRRVDLGAYEFVQPDVFNPTIYYVATNGNDTETGTSTGKAWRTLSHAVNMINGGDTLYVRGGTYREQVEVISDCGTASNPLYIFAYSNEIPIVKGADVVTNWLFHSGSIWKQTNWTIHTGQVVDDGVVLRQIGWPNDWYQLPEKQWIYTNTGYNTGFTLGDMTNSTFFCDTNSDTLYIWLADSSDPTGSVMEVSTRTLLLDNGENLSALHLRGLSFRYCNTIPVTQAGWPGIFLGNDSVMEDCDIQWCDMAGVAGGASQLVRCKISNNGGSGGGAQFMDGCQVLSNNYRRLAVDDAAAVGKFMGACNGVIIEHCEIAGNYAPAVWLDHATGDLFTIRNNYIHDNLVGDALFIEMSKRVHIYNNLIVSNKPTGTHSEILITASDDVHVFNNTVIGGRGILLSGAGRDEGDLIGTVTSNRVFNNIFYNSGECSLIGIPDLTCPYATNNYGDYNCYYNGNTSTLVVQWDCPYSLTNYGLAAWRNASGWDSHSSMIDPGLVGCCLPYNSPCIDRGTNVGALVSTDYEGVPRPLDGDNDGVADFDIGAFEFVSSLSDTDQDGLSDASEVDDVQTDPTIADCDGDTQLDGAEFIAGTDPWNSAIFFGLDEPSSLPVTGGFVVAWQSVTGRLYTVSACTNMPVLAWTNLPDAALLEGTGARMSVTNSMNDTIRKLYRVGVKRQ